MPRSMMAGLSTIFTVAQRDSNLSEVLRMNLGCRVSGIPIHGTQPSSAISWQPLHTPSEKVSARR